MLTLDSLSLPSLTLSPMSLRPTSYTPNSAPVGASGGGSGASAYYNGRTGESWQRGTAPFGFQQSYWNALSQVNRDMQAAGLGRLRITDGWRSYNKQVITKQRKGNLAATPGHSVHGLGLAADLDLTPKQQKWLEANANRYGIHRLASESWHWQLDSNKWDGNFDRGSR